MLPVFGHGVVDIGLFTRGNAAVDLVDVVLIQQFKENDACTRIQYLLSGCAVCLILELDSTIS